MKRRGKVIPVVVASVLLVSGLRPRCAAQESRYVPIPPAVTITPRTKDATVSVGVRVDLPTPCYRVGDWGSPLVVGSRVSVDAQFWSRYWPPICVQVISTVSTQYNLGQLPPGNYDFVFRAWGTSVKTQTFLVASPEQPRLTIRSPQMELCWNTSSNAWYQLQSRSTPMAGQWTPITPWLPGNGSALCTNDPAATTQAQKYYRVVRTNSPPAL